MSKNNQGGKREGASPPRLPKGEHKKILAIYVEQDFIDELGGKKKLQEEIKEWIYGRLVHKRLEADGIVLKNIE